jgi:hypothetical protein
MIKKRIYEIISSLLILLMTIYLSYILIQFSDLIFSSTSGLHMFSVLFMAIMGLISTIFVFLGKSWAKIMGLVIMIWYPFVHLIEVYKFGIIALNLIHLLSILGIVILIISLRE